MALRSLGIDEVLCLGEKDFESTLACRLYGNVLPILRASHRGLTTKEVDAVRQSVETAGDGDTPDSNGGGVKRALVVFPERSVGGSEGSVRPWRVGVAYLASKLGYPVVPAFVSGTQSVLPQHYSIPTKGNVAVEFGLFFPPPADSASAKESSLFDPELHLPAPRKQALAQFDAQLQAAVLALRLSLRQRRTKWWHHTGRNKKLPKGAGPAEMLAWAWRWVAGTASVAAVAGLMLALRLLDTAKVLLVRGVLAARTVVARQAQQLVE